MMIGFPEAIERALIAAGISEENAAKAREEFQRIESWNTFEVTGGKRGYSRKPIDAEEWEG